MSKLYSSPLRVYLLLSALALVGIYSLFNLPISLYPNSSKPTLWAGMPYGSQTAEEFVNTYGRDLESQLRKISTAEVAVESVRATYEPFEVEYEIEFKWGVVPTSALREVRNIINSFASRLPESSRDSVWVWMRNKNSGFLALSFFSNGRSLDDLYEVLEPVLMPEVSKVEDAMDPQLFNPSRKEIRIELIPEAVAELQLFPRNIEEALNVVLSSRSGGAITVDTRRMNILMPRQPIVVEDLGKTLIPTPSGKGVHLSDIARIDLGPKTNDARSFKTSGTPSLILFATPRAGGNVKKMSEDILRIVEKTMPSLPKDIQYKVLVDPSEFIRSAVKNVFREVGIGAMLAVAILFIFIGSFRNVVTAAIEIPLSMILAFILMRLSGMNLNLISLGGLALSAGMNVDASVVVMENIFRHFDMAKGPQNYASRLKIILGAVREVAFPVIASTIASVVVFLPLAFTSDLSYAILGDLAKTVVFSHSFSAIVALILVPTVRLQLLSREKEAAHHPPIEKQLKKLESWYGSTLSAFISRPRLKWGMYAGLAAALGILGLLVLPRLPKEVIGLPDTDWLILRIDTQGNTLLRQMEAQAEEVEAAMLKQFGSKIQYTFSQVYNPNGASLMARLKDREDMRELWRAMETRFSNTPFLRFSVNPWNPSELPIPNPPHLRIAIRGGEVSDRADTAQAIRDLLEEKKIFPRIWNEPMAEKVHGVVLVPNIEQWTELRNQNVRFTPSDLADLVLVASQGRRVGQLPLKSRLTDIMLRFPPNEFSSPEDVGALPVGVGSKLVPLKALTKLDVREIHPTIYREDERELFIVEARHHIGDEYKAKDSLALAKTQVIQWQEETNKPKSNSSSVSVTFEDPAKDLNEAIHQLGIAVALSVLLIFLTLLVQFGSFVEPLLVLVSVPLGFIGVLLSLFVFRSTLSLNSVLGVILLNGIAVANSIILVDFIKKQMGLGKPPREAAIEAATKRLRPILITSLTTILGMLPIALGMGEGGRILQPLGIAVSGGLWVSMGLTLFLVPALYVSYLEWSNETPPIRRFQMALSLFLGRLRQLRLPRESRSSVAHTSNEIL